MSKAKRDYQMSAQDMYDFRAKWEFCSGTDLREFFSQQIGDPSPPGSKKVSAREAIDFVTTSLFVMAHNAPNLAKHCAKAAKAIYKFSPLPGKRAFDRQQAKHN